MSINMDKSIDLELANNFIQTARTNFLFSVNNRQFNNAMAWIFEAYAAEEEYDEIWHSMTDAEIDAHFNLIDCLNPDNI